ncbi:hypothetical protein GCM10010399_40500 [Dactylosporangium fulvum]
MDTERPLARDEHRPPGAGAVHPAPPRLAAPDRGKPLAAPATRSFPRSWDTALSGAHAPDTRGNERKHHSNRRKHHGNSNESAYSNGRPHHPGHRFRRTRAGRTHPPPLSGALTDNAERTTGTLRNSSIAKRDQLVADQPDG